MLEQGAPFRIELNSYGWTAYSSARMLVRNRSGRCVRRAAGDLELPRRHASRFFQELIRDGGSRTQTHFKDTSRFTHRGLVDSLLPRRTADCFPESGRIQSARFEQILCYETKAQQHLVEHSNLRPRKVDTARSHLKCQTMTSHLSVDLSKIRVVLPGDLTSFLDHPQELPKRVLTTGTKKVAVAASRQPPTAQPMAAHGRHTSLM